MPRMIIMAAPNDRTAPSALRESLLPSRSFCNKSDAVRSLLSSGGARLAGGGGDEPSALRRFIGETSVTRNGPRRRGAARLVDAFRPRVSAGAGGGLRDVLLQRVLCAAPPGETRLDDRGVDRSADDLRRGRVCGDAAARDARQLDAGCFP